MRQRQTVRSRVFMIVLFIGLGCVALRPAHAEYAGAKVTVLKKATTAANGQKLEYFRTEKPEVTALIVEIPSGGDTGWHTHPIPVYAYILSGSLTVEFENGRTIDFQEGDVIFEVINTPHIGRNKGKIPAKLVVFYTGEEGGPLTVKLPDK